MALWRLLLDFLKVFLALFLGRVTRLSPAPFRRTCLEFFFNSSLFSGSELRQLLLCPWLCSSRAHIVTNINPKSDYELMNIGAEFGLKSWLDLLSMCDLTNFFMQIFLFLCSIIFLNPETTQCSGHNLKNDSSPICYAKKLRWCEKISESLFYCNFWHRIILWCQSGPRRPKNDLKL